MSEYEIIDAVSSNNVPSWGNAKQYIAVHYLGVVGENHEIDSDGCGAHYYIYWDGTIYQRCSHDAVVWQVGTAGCYTQKHPYARNANTIGIEMCCKCDGNSASAEDPYWYFTEETQEACVWLVQKLMSELGIPSDNVLRHYDIVNKTCPAPYVHNNGYKTAWTWDEFKDRINGGDSNWYRVRLSWDDETSQIGAYHDLDIAVSSCPYGYTVYDWNGSAVWPAADGGGYDGTLGRDFAGLTEEEAAEALLDICTPIALGSGLFPSVCTAQTILESGYCTTDLAVEANNVCGMKCQLSGNTWPDSTWEGVSMYRKDTEEQDSAGNVYIESADFRAYPCIEDSIADRCAYLLGAANGSKLRYEGITECADYAAQAQLIKDGGYATDVQYVDKLCGIIERFGLDRYDGYIDVPSQPERTGGWYRVRTSWEEAESQIGAYQTLEYAIRCANDNPGYNVYDESGGAVYVTSVYYVQAGAFADETNAERQMASLNEAGFDAFVKYSSEDGMYHVQCGAFSEPGNAEELAENLKACGFESIIK